MYQIKDSEILKKIIELQSCIIKGKKISTLLHTNRDFFLSKSKADTIVVYMHEDGHINADYILEKKMIFFSLVQKYINNRKSFSWSKFVRNYDNYFNGRSSSYKISNCFDLFKGYISQKNARAFTEELGMKQGFIIPFYNYDGKEKIGYVCFIFNTEDESVTDIEALRSIRTSLETLFQPLYDKEYHTLYTKCIRIDEEMKMLTEKEKEVIKKVLEGISYSDIAMLLNISINTLKTHMKNIFNKYNVKSRIELYRKLHVHV